jgi:hypothetical protein
MVSRDSHIAFRSRWFKKDHKKVLMNVSYTTMKFKVAMGTEECKNCGFCDALLMAAF